MKTESIATARRRRQVAEGTATDSPRVVLLKQRIEGLIRDVFDEPPTAALVNLFDNLEAACAAGLEKPPHQKRPVLGMSGKLDKLGPFGDPYKRRSVLSVEPIADYVEVVYGTEDGEGCPEREGSIVLTAEEALELADALHHFARIETGPWGRGDHPARGDHQNIFYGARLVGVLETSAERADNITANLNALGVRL